MKYNFDETGDHRQDGSIRWEQPEGRDDIIGMGTADMDFTCAPCIRKVLQPICEENTYNYRFSVCDTMVSRKLSVRCEERLDEQCAGNDWSGSSGYGEIQ